MLLGAMKPTVLALALFGCTACSSVAQPRTPDSPVDAARGARTFVWATEEAKGADAPSEGAVTLTYVLADDGTLLTTRPGLRVWAAGTEWVSEATEEAVPTTACEEEGPERAAQEGQGIRVRMVPGDSSHTPLEIVSPAPAGANEVDQSARLLGSVGPYVFVEGTTYEYTCGAHGNTDVWFAVWNLEEGRMVDLLSNVPDREHVLAQGRDAIDARSDALDFSRPDDPPALTELLPRVTADGRLEVSALVTVASCYACTEGGWSSYTVSTEVPAQPPWRLTALGPAPRAVALFVAAHPELTIGGYSVAD
jgi:hypothetical protein